jgi:hypothetical protein
MKYILTLLTTIALSSCSDAFINHSLKYEKLGACSSEQVPVKMLSNIAGEQYEFVSCLDDNFDGKNYLVERRGDSIIVSFPKTAIAKAAFKITLDIDAKPAYQHIILDGIDIPIAQQ